MLGPLRLVAAQAAVSVIFWVAVGVRLDHSIPASIGIQVGLKGFGGEVCRSLCTGAWLILGTQWEALFIVADIAVVSLFGLSARPQRTLRLFWLVPLWLEMGGQASAHVSRCRCVTVHGVGVVTRAGRYAHGAGFRCRLVLWSFDGQAGKPCSCEWVAVVIIEGIAGSLQSRWGRWSSSSISAVWVHTRITVRILHVQTRWCLLDPLWRTVRIGLRVTAEVSVGWSHDSSGLVTVSGTEVVLQTLNIFRITDAQQLGLLLS